MLSQKIQLRCPIGCAAPTGWSPATFAKLIDAGFDVLTYRKTPYAPDPEPAFTTVTYTDPHGVQHTYPVAASTVTFDVADGKTLTQRQVMRRTDDGKQIAILTSSAAPTGEVCWRISARWHQENYSAMPGNTSRSTPSTATPTSPTTRPGSSSTRPR